ncbi:MAG: branched-chain amino acid ABC transporter permease [Bacillota bacterium]
MAPTLNVWINALVLGSIYVLIASGLMLVFSVMGILNFAHGQLYMVGGFMTFLFFAKFGLNYFVAILFAMIFVMTLGVILEKYLIRPVSQKGFVAGATITLGVIYIFEGLATVIFGVGQNAVPTVFEGSLKIGAASVSWEKVALIILSIVTMSILYFLIMKTKMGLGIRASAQEPVAAKLYGVQVGRLASVVMAMGSGLAALAGGFMAPVYYVDPWMGGGPLIMCILAIVIGGLGSLPGAVVGGLLLGVTGSLVAYYLGSWAELVAFGLVIGILLIRPQGLFGVKVN